MPASPFYHRDDDRDAATITLAASDMSLRDHSPMYTYDDSVHYEPMISDTDNMIFGLDIDDALHQESKSTFSWEPAHHLIQYSSLSSIPFPGSPDSTTSQLDPSLPTHTRRFDSTFSNASSGYFPPSSPPEFNDSALYSNWIADPVDVGPHQSSLPIPIPAGHANPQSPLSSPYAAYSENSAIFPDVTAFSPSTALAALQPLPLSPPEDTVMTEQLHTEVPGSGPPPASLFGGEPPAWASQLWDSSNMSSPGGPVPIMPLSSEDNFATQRPRIPIRRGTPVSHLFQSSSAPSPSHARPSLVHSRPYSTRRSESISEHDDRDATVRKKKRPVEEVEEAQEQEKRSESRKSSSCCPYRDARDIDTSKQLPLSQCYALPNWRPLLGSSTSPTGSSVTRLPVTRSSMSHKPLKRPARNTLSSLPTRRRYVPLLRLIHDRS